MALGPHMVGVLRHQRRQQVWGVGRERLVEMPEFVHHDVHRDAVVDAVVERQQEYVALGPQGEQTAASERACFAVERPPCLVELAGGHTCVAVRAGDVGEVLEGQGEPRARRVDVLAHVTLRGQSPGHIAFLPTLYGLFRSSSFGTAYPGTEGQRRVSTTDSSSAAQE